jgi:hypothetical protein
MKCQRGPLTASRAAAVYCLRFAAIVLAAASLGVAAGCGSEDQQPSGVEFSDRLENIAQQGSQRWGLLAQRAEDLNPGEPLTADIKQPMRELVAFQRRAADALGELTVPEGAADEVNTLVEALRERTVVFEQALQSGRFTQRQADRITQAGNRIDLAFDQLSKEGFLPKVEKHNEE